MRRLTLGGSVGEYKIICSSSVQNEKENMNVCRRKSELMWRDSKSRHYAGTPSFHEQVVCCRNGHRFLTGTRSIGTIGKDSTEAVGTDVFKKHVSNSISLRAFKSSL